MEKKIIVKPNILNSFLKRLFDLILSTIALIVLSPLFLIVSIIIKLNDGGPVFFVQNRVGKNGKLFKMMKFRSMKINAEEELESLLEKNEMSGGVLFKMQNDPRITKVGKFIRKTSIDELPQLYNIFLGSMTIVGPRPALEREVAQYTEGQKDRLLVKQGLTCWWQCSGRSNSSFEEQVELDLKYVRKNNIFIDLWLIILTVPAVLFSKGSM